jgi:hypothetical protein
MSVIDHLPFINQHGVYFLQVSFSLRKHFANGKFDLARDNDHAYDYAK